MQYAGDFCRNCESDNFVVDYQQGTVYCRDCGCCDDQPVTVAGGTFKKTFDANGTRRFDAPLFESTIVGAVDTTALYERMAETVKNVNSPPYKRETYFAERISQWRLGEPEIDESDMRIIVARFGELTGKWEIEEDRVARPRSGHFSDWHWEGMSPVGPNPLDKEDVRFLLWDCDRRRVELGGKPLFVKKYLVSFNFLFFLVCFASTFFTSKRSDLFIAMHGGLWVHSTA